jgi:hypothetical protein
MSRLDPGLRRSHTSSLRGRVCSLLAVTASGFALACSPVLGTLGAAASPGAQTHHATATAAKKKKCKKGYVLRRNRCVRRVGSGY